MISRLMINLRAFTRSDDEATTHHTAMVFNSNTTATTAMGDDVMYPLDLLHRDVEEGVELQRLK